MRRREYIFLKMKKTYSSSSFIKIKEEEETDISLNRRSLYFIFRKSRCIEHGPHSLIETHGKVASEFQRETAEARTTEIHRHHQQRCQTTRPHTHPPEPSRRRLPQQPASAATQTSGPDEPVGSPSAAYVHTPGPGRVTGEAIDVDRRGPLPFRGPPPHTSPAPRPNRPADRHVTPSPAHP